MGHGSLLIQDIFCRNSMPCPYNNDITFYRIYHLSNWSGCYGCNLIFENIHAVNE